MEKQHDDIYKQIWDLSPNVQNIDAYNKLNQLTQKLIDVYDSQGRLTSDPFDSTRSRRLDQPYHKLKGVLRDTICLVTGGLGCVGSTLVNELLKFDVKTIIILDNNKMSPYTVELSPLIKIVYGDIRDTHIVNETFTKYRPEIIFHTAAQRDPGYAETHITETVATNVMGTLNIVKACEATESVKQCVFSSTGKASRYFTEEVYAATKKICENILDLYSRGSRVKYGAARFTHMLDNSLMNDQIKSSSERDNYVSIHSPGKYVTAQNKKEAVSLMLNTLLYSQFNQSNILLVRNLEWPVESLEVALYHIKKSERNIPIIFSGNPMGYTEKFFRGQMDWSDPSELNVLINVYENKCRKLNEERDIVISHICQSSRDTIKKALNKISSSQGEKESKDHLIEGLKEIVKDSLRKVSKKDTVDILNWGLQQKFLDAEKTKISDYGSIIPMMFESLNETPYQDQVAHLTNEELNDFLVYAQSNRY